MKKVTISILSIVVVLIVMVFYAYWNTIGKKEIEFTIHINEDLVRATTYGEPPTFAIWLEDPRTKKSKTVFVTRRAGSNDWEGKAEIPSALPLWNSIFKNSEKDSSTENPQSLAISGATPKPGYFVTRAQVEPGSIWTCWIEVNLSGDYNEFYPEYDYSRNYEDTWGTGQPALVYHIDMELTLGNTYTPAPIGMSIHNQSKILHPIKGITTASEIFDDIKIEIVRPQPKIF